jgi:hypothetical protein
VFYDYTKPFNEKLTRLIKEDHDLEDKDLDGTITPKELARAVEVRKEQNALVRQRGLLQDFREFNELWADAVVVFLNNDPDFMVRPLVLQEERGLAKSAYQDRVAGKIAHFYQRSFAADHRFVIHDNDAYAQFGFDPYSILNGARYFLGTLINPEMAMDGRRKILSSLVSAIGETTAKIREAGLTSYKLPFADLNARLIGELEARTGRRSTISLSPEFNGYFSQAPKQLIDFVNQSGRTRTTGR